MRGGARRIPRGLPRTQPPAQGRAAPDAGTGRALPLLSPVGRWVPLPAGCGIQGSLQFSLLCFSSFWPFPPLSLNVLHQWFSHFLRINSSGVLRPSYNTESTHCTHTPLWFPCEGHTCAHTRCTLASVRSTQCTHVQAHTLLSGPCEDHSPQHLQPHMCICFNSGG